MDSFFRPINFHSLVDPIQWSGVFELFHLVNNVPVYAFVGLGTALLGIGIREVPVDAIIGKLTGGLK